MYAYNPAASYVSQIPPRPSYILILNKISRKNLINLIGIKIEHWGEIKNWNSKNSFTVIFSTAFQKICNIYIVLKKCCLIHLLFSKCCLTAMAKNLQNILPKPLFYQQQNSYASWPSDSNILKSTIVGFFPPETLFNCASWVLAIYKTRGGVSCRACLVQVIA